MAKDFSHKNLRGRNFKGQDLTEANFSHADIRGADFTKAILRKANFTGSEAGLQRYWVIGLSILSLVLAAIAGLSSAIASYFLVSFFLPPNIEEYTILLGVFVSVGFAIFFIVTIRQGLEGSLWAVVVVAGTFAAAGTVVGGPLVGLTIAAIAVMVAAAAFGAVAVALAEAIAGLGWLAGFMLVALATAVALASDLAVMVAVAGIGVGASWVAAAVVLAGLYAYIGWRALSREEKFPVVRRIAVAFAAMGGTSFREADLTNADFTQARLKSTDLRGAILTCTCWLQAEKLDRARVGGTYLENLQMWQLLTSGVGQDKNFDRQDLRGFNLRKTNLANASFIGADLYQANLQEADLSGAKLVRAQLESANLTGATLTGACIEDWFVTRSTKLNAVVCKYVYMKFVNGDKREQMPPRGEFKDGEFMTFVRSIMDTLDLYHEQDVNPRAAVIVLKSLSEDYQEPLEIVGLENRGNGIIIKLKISEWANQEQIQEKYYFRYSQLTLSLADPDKFLPKYFLPQYEEVIEAKFSELVEEVKKYPTTSIKYFVNSGLMFTGGNVSMNIDRREQSINTGGGDINFSGAGTLIGDISGNVTNAINQIPDSPQSNQLEIKESLKQLQAAIVNESDLPLEDKAEALEQVEVLAEAGKNPQAGAMQKMGKTAIKILKGTVAGLPSAAKLLEACNTLAKLLGLG